ncbi:hypothetical protein B9Z65_8471 [Elsinoe australis]|uniref:Uncharacterized protein n=1 Tax=Elsinoe australis TaxID=40998 RepID=A0A2P7YDW2_9PEZI|nr:hypothetical protein B9Z65_8471 [Elsinoe australis]
MMDTTQLIEAIAQCNRDVQDGKPGARERLLPLTYQLSASVETPSQTIWRTFFSDPIKAATTRAAVDLNMFEQLKTAKGTPKTAAELAEPSKASAALVRRLAAYLVSVSIIGETGADQYISTPLSDAFTEARFAGGVIYGHDVVAKSSWQIPDYLRKRGYENPSNPVDAPLQDAFGTKEHFFPYISASPLLIKSFNDFMGAYRLGKQPWNEFYPIQERLLSDSPTDSTVLVDVGGSLGHDLIDTLKKFPQLKGRLVLQDRPEVIGSIKELTEGIEKQAHDFFTPQQVQAKAFYLHSVLHDWDDESCISILQNLIPAMSKGSKVLINDLLVPDQDPNWSVTTMDLAMMALGSVKERTESEWKDLVARAGLKVTGIFTSFDPSTECIIEAELP